MLQIHGMISFEDLIISGKNYYSLITCIVSEVLKVRGLASSISCFN